MNCDFNTFTPQSDQMLAENHFKDYSGRYTGTTEWMFRFVCWLKDLDGVYAPDIFQTALKTGTKALAIIGMIITCPLIIGGFLLKWYSNAERNVNDILNDLRRTENKRRTENEQDQQIIKALGVEKQGIVIPNIESKPSKEDMGAIFEENKSPIFQCNGNFIALLIQDKKTKQKRIATIEKTNQGWEFKKLRSARTSESHGGGGDLPSEYYKALDFGKGIYNLKTILKGRGDYDELAFDLIRNPQEKFLLGGPCITDDVSIVETAERAERVKIIEALGGEERVKTIPVLKKRPISRYRMDTFEQLQSPIFQSGGNFIAILIQDKETQERKTITVKKVNDAWTFRKFPVNQAHWGGCHGDRINFTTRIQWLLENGSIRTRTFNDQTILGATQCETHIEFLEEVAGESENKYKLAEF